MKHSSNQVKSKKSQAYLLIFLGWLVYATSYLGKVNYSANITQIIDFYGITKAQAGTVSSFFFFAYGIGQVVNGILCRRYNTKWMIFGSLMVSATINLVIAVSTDFAMIKWLWLVNGFTLSILWPTIIRLLSETLPQKVLGTSSVVMGTTVAIGTLVIYGLSSIFAAFHRFKLSFYSASFAVIAVAIIRVFTFVVRSTPRDTPPKKSKPFVVFSATWSPPRPRHISSACFALSSLCASVLQQPPTPIDIVTLTLSLVAILRILSSTPNLSAISLCRSSC